MPKPKNPFVEGAKVKIVVPKFFVRCGYPLCLEDETNSMIEAKQKEIEAFVLSIVRPDVPAGLLPGPKRSHVEHGTMTKIAKALAYESMKNRKFGGRTRAIFTKDYPECAGAVARIASSRFVKTGEYVPGHHYCTMDGDDYDPPYLDNEKTHRILGLESLDARLRGDEMYPFQIEAANVEIIA